MHRLFGILIGVLSAAVMAIPQFTNCFSDGKLITLANGSTIPMKCLWTARAELGVGIGLLAVGILLASSKRKESIRSLSVIGVVLGVIVILLPTSLIGVCSSRMVCNIIMQPAMEGLGAIITAGSLFSLVLSLMKRKES